MCKIERILVPVDFSECSWAALKYAAFWAARFGAELRFLHVWRVPWYLDDYALTRTGASNQTLSALARNKAEAEMARFVWDLEKENGLTLRCTVTSGTPRNMILEIAGLRDYDLIVMGTHGRTGLAQLFLGSTTEGVVRRAPCPVLTVREKLHRTGKSSRELDVVETVDTDGPDDIRLKRILVPLDFCECSTAALEYAVELSRVFDAAVDVLHVVDPPYCDVPLATSHCEPRLGLPQLAVNESTTKLVEIVKPLQDRNVAIEPQVVAGDTRDVILKAIDTQQYDMVIVGTHGRKGVSHFFLGSIAEQIVRRASCPVLTIRSPHNGE